MKAIATNGKHILIYALEDDKEFIENRFIMIYVLTTKYANYVKQTLQIMQTHYITVTVATIILYLNFCQMHFSYQYLIINKGTLEVLEFIPSAAILILLCISTTIDLFGILVANFFAM